MTREKDGVSDDSMEASASPRPGRLALRAGLAAFGGFCFLHFWLLVIFEWVPWGLYTGWSGLVEQLLTVAIFGLPVSGFSAARSWFLEQSRSGIGARLGFAILGLVISCGLFVVAVPGGDLWDEIPWMVFIPSTILFAGCFLRSSPIASCVLGSSVGSFLDSLITVRDAGRFFYELHDVLFTIGPCYGLLFAILCLRSHYRISWVRHLGQAGLVLVLFPLSTAAVRAFIDSPISHAEVLAFVAGLLVFLAGIMLLGWLGRPPRDAAGRRSVV